MGREKYRAVVLCFGRVEGGFPFEGHPRTVVFVKEEQCCP